MASPQAPMANIPTTNITAAPPPIVQRALTAEIGGHQPSYVSSFFTAPTPTKPEHIWLDCDPGHDDTFAIILAGHSPLIKLIGISTVTGNQTLDQTTRNTLNVLHSSGLSHIPCFAGRHEPLMRIARVSQEMHGDSGLDGAEFPKHSLQIQPERAVDAIYNACKKHLEQEKSTERSESANKQVNPASKLLDHSQSSTKSDWNTEDRMNLPFTLSTSTFGNSEGLTIVATGPLTNIAVLLLMYPEVKMMIKRIVLMGGAMGTGNLSPVAEFNILIDPEAASIVFNSGLPIQMVPLEVTHTALATPQILDALTAYGTLYTKILKELVLFFADRYLEVFGFPSPPVHDPCAVACIIAPELFEFDLMRVDIEITSALSEGQTVCDIYHRSRDMKRSNVFVAKRMNVDGFWTLLMKSISKANKMSPLAPTKPN